MKPIDLCEYLAAISYPGRGLLLGRSADAKRAVIAYFIMGRSENSRNRVLAPKDGGVITRAYDASKVTDPSLILYAPVRVVDEKTTVVTNGDQTDTVAQFLLAGRTFEEALRGRTFEPDAPNYTPRISGLLTVADGRMACKLSIIKSADGDPESVERFFFDYPQPKSGEGRLIHTYLGDGTPLPSYAGEPARVALCCEDIDHFATTLWGALDMQNKVCLFVRTVELAGGHTETRILNSLG